MPIARGAKGMPGVLAIPGLVKALGPAGPQFAHRFGKRQFRSRPLSTLSAYITGITKDSAGVALGDCTVQLFRTWNDAYLGETISDGAGAYSIAAPGSAPFYLVAYKAGAPDVAGTTVNTLEPA